MNQEEARKLAGAALDDIGLAAFGAAAGSGFLRDEINGGNISVPSNGFVQFVPANLASGQYDAVLVELIMEIPLNG